MDDRNILLEYLNCGNDISYNKLFVVIIQNAGSTNKYARHINCLVP